MKKYLVFTMLFVMVLTACNPTTQPTNAFVTVTPGPATTETTAIESDMAATDEMMANPAEDEPTTSTPPPVVAGPTPLPIDLTGLGFSDQTEAAGVTWLHGTPLGRKEDGSMMMVGAAAGDFNRDGWVDLFVIGGGLNADALFINNGDGTFTNTAPQAGLDERHAGAGAAVGDYDGDGWLDIYVTSFGPLGFPGPGQNRLYHNNGDGTFSEVAAAAGVNLTSADDADGMGASFGDYDRDGDLDLAVAGWRRGSQGNRLFQNNGDGTFSDVTDPAGIVDDGIRGFSPCFADMDNDTYPDLIWVADFGTSRYFINQGDGTFSEQTTEVGAGKEWSGMGLATADFNRDGLLDWYATAIFEDDDVGRGDGNKLYYNLGNQRFSEGAQAAGVDDGGWAWGAIAVDFNHDGHLDLAQTNGWADLPSYAGEASKVWLNSGNGAFLEVPGALGMDHTADGRGMLHFDYDNDGDQDVVITAIGDSVQLNRNDLDRDDANWLRVWLDTSARPNLPPDGIGSKIRLKVGDEIYYRDILACPHYLTQSELSAHFGLGAAESIDDLQIIWADGSTTTLTDVALNQALTVAAE